MRDGNEKNLEVQAGYFEREGFGRVGFKVTFYFLFYSLAKLMFLKKNNIFAFVNIAKSK